MDLVESLRHLVKVDMDAVGAYTQAIYAIRDRDIKEQLVEFRADHQQHVSDLTNVILDLGGKPPQKPHASGFVLAGFTRIASGMSLPSALMAMQSNEVVTNQAYEMALDSNDLTSDVKRLLDRNHRDEQRHLEAIRWMLEDSTPMGKALSATATAQGAGTSLWLNVIKENPMAAMVAASGAAMLIGGAIISRRR
ncbi:ferritin-like domain-containing protein [Telmatospirillum sp. J64-1]|uniref:ferritin-like domain-containing protein n=1 Tax=Telmatospirillum sp. J64-1 TaxID=2502183 RepID=UPI00115F4EB7|nr:ferritin-like domain-containing protein [Telmatospirillum sp. J64-1]